MISVLFFGFPRFHSRFQSSFTRLNLITFLTKTHSLLEQEKEELIQEWQPEPLTPKVDPNHFALNSKVVSSKLGKYIELDGRRCLNLGSHNYLGFSEEKDVEEQAIKTLRKYGCGSCGPRAFFGTVGEWNLVNSIYDFRWH